MSSGLAQTANSSSLGGNALISKLQREKELGLEQIQKLTHMNVDLRIELIKSKLQTFAASVVTGLKTTTPKNNLAYAK